MSDPSAVLATDAELEAVVGPPPKAIMLKSIGFLDDHCRRFLACSPFAVLGTTTADGARRMVALGGEPGVASAGGDVLELDEVSGADLIDGAPAGMLALVPGYGETLRINGRLRVAGARAALEVEEAFLHCAKAIVRSQLWSTPAASDGADRGTTPTLEDFLGQAPFVLLASIDGDGRADVSPKGDPAGLIRRIDDTTIAIADRPGNRRTDTLHNLMDDPRLALLAMVPGSGLVAEIRGTARVSTDPELLESMRLRKRTPKVAVVIDVEHRELRDEPAIAAAHLWDPNRHVAKGTLPRAAAIWADHVRRNDDTSTGAKVARRVVSETALAAGVALDYRTNL